MHICVHVHVSVLLQPTCACMSALSSNRVVELTDKEVKMKNKATGDIYTVPYGLCVWSTGVAPRKLTRQMIESLQTPNKRA